eukprot:g4848.t1
MTTTDASAPSLSKDLALAMARKSIKKRQSAFSSSDSFPEETLQAKRKLIEAKVEIEYSSSKNHPLWQAVSTKKKSAIKKSIDLEETTIEHSNAISMTSKIAADFDESQRARKRLKDNDSRAIVSYKVGEEKTRSFPQRQSTALAMRRKLENMVSRPKWHAPWKLKTVISGHIGWVRCVAVDPTNEWFVSGSADRTIKLWDLASGGLKLTLTGHINTVRAVAISEKYPYLFSAGEDKMVKCWDLEYNRVNRHYHGHHSGVYSLALHPLLPVLFTGGRDAVCRVWDMRTTQQIHSLGGHKDTVTAIASQGADPQLITASEDATIRLWDLRMGKSLAVLTNHKKGIRALVLHKTEFSFASASVGQVKKWLFPKGKFLQNFSGHNTIINSLSLNDDNVLVSGGNDGTLRFWDWKSGYCFQKEQSIVQPGSLDCEAGIFGSCFDQSGSRLITVEADKTIKIWAEDESATEESHPIDFAGWTEQCRKRRKY